MANIAPVELDMDQGAYKSLVAKMAANGISPLCGASVEDAGLSHADMACYGYELHPTTRMWWCGGEAVGAPFNRPTKQSPTPADVINAVVQVLGNDKARITVEERGLEGLHDVPELVVTIGETITPDQREVVINTLSSMVSMHMKVTVKAPVKMLGQIKQIIVDKETYDVKREVETAGGKCPHCIDGMRQPLFFGRPYPCKTCDGSGNV
jgi:hypothetical protein